MCIYSPMPHTLSYCALIGKFALIRSNTVYDISGIMEIYRQRHLVDRREPKFFLHYMVSLKLQYFTFIVIEKIEKKLWNTTDLTNQVLGCVAQSVGHLTPK